MALPITRYYSAFEDNPWPLLFKELDSLYPESRFILTYRVPEHWFRSAARFHSGRLSAMHDLIYGEPHFRIEDNKQKALDRFNRHNEEVTTSRTDPATCWNGTSHPIRAGTNSARSSISPSPIGHFRMASAKSGKVPTIRFRQSLSRNCSSRAARSSPSPESEYSQVGSA